MSGKFHPVPKKKKIDHDKLDLIAGGAKVITREESEPVKEGPKKKRQSTSKSSLKTSGKYPWEDHKSDPNELVPMSLKLPRWMMAKLDWVVRHSPDIKGKQPFIREVLEPALDKEAKRLLKIWGKNDAGIDSE